MLSALECAARNVEHERDRSRLGNTAKDGRGGQPCRFADKWSHRLGTILRGGLRTALRHA
jgi:hypothetical protein